MISQNDWFNLICESYLKPPQSYRGRELPRFPSDTVQKNTTGQSGVDTLRNAFVFYQDCMEAFERIGSPLRENHRLLDFGVGWGRISRFFLRELPLENIYGMDVGPESVKMCAEDFGSQNFHVSRPLPPASLVDGAVDFVVGYSVFSHLSEATCHAWMQEFHRLLAPGGIAVLTTRGRPFFDFCESLQGTAVEGYLHHLSMMFDDFDEARRRYDNGEFVHSNVHGVTGGGVLSGDFYGESFIPESYVKKAYADYFTLEQFLFDPARHEQPIMFFRRK